jgi:diguanylate cyclase (GGDEF)-like protein
MTGGESTWELLRRGFPRWPLEGLPRWLQVMVAGVIASWLAAVVAAAAVTPLLAGQLRLFGLLAACSAVAVEVTRRSGEPGGVDRDVYAIWDLPLALLLPPLYALLMPVPRMVMIQWRIRRAPVHRRAYSAAAIGMAYAAASLVFHAVVPALGGGAGAGWRALAWTALAGGCALLRVAVNDGLVLAAVKGSSPGTPLLPELIGPEAVYGNVAELSFSVLSAFAVSRSPLLVLWALPLVVILQRGLRWAQLMRESRTDAKTGLLNDAAWRRAAAAELARAARAGAMTAVAIADIDHFKSVNDTYGHAAGDAVLAAVAATIRDELRGYDAVGRVGGEEMAFVLPATSYPEAIAAAQRVRLAVSRADLAGGGDLRVPPFVTVSVGVAVAGHLAGWDLARHYGLADSALYAAKRNGRDCVWGVCDGQAEGLAPRPGIALAALPAPAITGLGTLPGVVPP